MTEKSEFSVHGQQVVVFAVNYFRMAGFCFRDRDDDKSIYTQYTPTDPTDSGRALTLPN